MQFNYFVIFTHPKMHVNLFAICFDPKYYIDVSLHVVFLGNRLSFQRLSVNNLTEIDIYSITL